MNEILLNIDINDMIYLGNYDRINYYYYKNFLILLYNNEFIFYYPYYNEYNIIKDWDTIFKIKLYDRHENKFIKYKELYNTLNNINIIISTSEEMTAKYKKIVRQKKIEKIFI